MTAEQLENLQQLDDAGLEQHRLNILAEMERRKKLSEIPTDIKKMADEFETLGGDKTELIDRINEPSEEYVEEPPVEVEEPELTQE